MPEIDLDEQASQWTTLPDGAEALLVNGGGVDGGSGAMVTHPRRRPPRDRAAGR